MRKVLFVALFALLITPMAFAATATSTMPVTATVNPNCTITAPTLTFVGYDTLAATATTATANLTVACTKNAPGVWIGLGQGAHDVTGTPAVPNRRMIGATIATDFLSYFLYSDAAYTVVWGNLSGAGKTYTSAGKAAVAIPVYGQIPAAVAGGLNDVSAQTYNDLVVATINF